MKFIFWILYVAYAGVMGLVPLFVSITSTCSKMLGLLGCLLVLLTFYKEGFLYVSLLVFLIVAVINGHDSFGQVHVSHLLMRILVSAFLIFLYQMI